MSSRHALPPSTGVADLVPVRGGGLPPFLHLVLGRAGVLCEIVNPEDGSMSRTPQLLEFAKQHRLRCITIADLVRYRLQYDVYGKEQPATQA